MRYPEPEIVYPEVEAVLWDVADGMDDAVAEGRLAAWSITSYEFNEDSGLLEINVALKMPLAFDFITVELRKDDFTPPLSAEDFEDDL